MREADAVIILCNKKCLSPDEEDAANITRYSYFLKPYKFPENILLETNVFFVLVQAKYFKHRCLLYTSPSPRDGLLSRMPSSA